MEELVNGLKQVDQHATEFIANGRKYYKANSLSIKRFIVKQKFDLAFSYGANFRQVFDTVSGAYKLLNERKDADAAVELFRLREGLINIDEGEVGALRLCTLFWNTEGEDVKTYQQEVMDRKIEDWSKEGIDVSFFLMQAMCFIPDLIAVCKERIQATLKVNPEAAATEV